MIDLIRLYRQGEDYFFRGISSKCLDLGHGATAYKINGTELNFIYITKSVNDLDKILIQGRTFFDQDNLNFEIIIPQELCTTQRTGILNLMGYPKKTETVSMAMNLERFLSVHTASFDDEITVKENDGHLNAWVMPLIGAFESTFEIGSLYAAAHENALKKNINLRHFSLYKQDNPIASLTLSQSNGSVRMDDVSTLPDFQGKGYATRLMRYVLAEAKKRGPHHCFLESTHSGLPVYQKLGFRSLFKNNIYSRQSSV